MTIEVGVSEFRRNLSRYLTLVERGEVVDVTRRGEVVVRFRPFDPHAQRQPVEQTTARP